MQLGSAQARAVALAGLLVAACSAGAGRGCGSNANAKVNADADASDTPSASWAGFARIGPLAKGTPCLLATSPASDAGPPVRCARFESAEDAFLAVVEATDPRVLAVGEAHARRGTEDIASATSRFTSRLLPLLAPRASDIVVELWAPNPGCQREVQAVAIAQKPVVNAQAASNVNEYELLGARAKALGLVPWLLRPTCDDFKAITDAGEGAVHVMLGLVKSLTATRVRQLLARNAADGGAPRAVVAYGGMMHNDLFPPPSTKEFSFAPDLVAASGGRYVELDLVVPEYVKPTPTWQSLPWYITHERAAADDGLATLYQTGERSFVLVFARSARGVADAGAVTD